MVQTKNRNRRFNLNGSRSKHARVARQNGKIKLLLIDEHEINLGAFTLYFSKRGNFNVASLLLDRAEAIRQAKDSNADVIVVNMRMPRFDAATATRRILEARAEARVIAFNGPEDKKVIASVLRLGVRGYVLGTCSSAELFQAVETVHRGELFFSPPILRLIANDYASGELEPKHQNGHQLGDRERKMVSLIADGLSNKEMASALGLRVRTVEKNRASLMDKLQIRTISGLTKFAIQNGMTNLD